MSSTSRVSSNSSSTNINRVAGLGSGIDIEDTINQIMQAESKPLDKLKQTQQSLLWKESAYRSQNTLLSTLRDDLFSLKMQSTYNTRTSTSSNQAVATATVTSNSPSGTYNINVIQMASNATNSSSSPLTMASSVTGDFLMDLTIDSGNHSFNITVDGVQKTITVPDGTYSYNPAAGQKSLQDLASAIQTQLNASSDTNPAFKTPVYAKVTSDNELVFYTGKNADGSKPTIVLGDAASNSALTALGFSNQESSQGVVGSILENDGTQPINIGLTNNKFKITLGNGAAKEITLNTGSYNMTQLAAEIQSEVQAMGGDYAKVNVTATKYNQIRFDTTATSGGALMGLTLNSGSSADALQTMGLSDGTGSATGQKALDVTASLASQKDLFIDSSFFNNFSASGASAFGFTINGQTFNFSLNNSINDIISGINSNRSAGVTAFYDQTSNKFVLTSNKAGNTNPDGADIQLGDPGNFLSSVFNISSANEVSGQNAIVSINGYQTQQAGNTFTINNTTFNLVGTGTSTVAVSTDTSGIATKVQKFITDYNAVVASMNSAISESRAKDTSGNYYDPLTDSQKEDMSDDQITKWENLAKQGQLQNDSVLQSVLFGIRSDSTRMIANSTSAAGLTLSGTIDLHNANQLKVTFGSQTKTISLDQNVYGAGQYSQLAADFQSKLNSEFGAGNITVSLKNNQITLTTSNRALTLNNGDTLNGLAKLGFSDGAAIQRTVSTLADIGISTSEPGSQGALAAAAENGKLYFDQDKFTQALQQNPDAVMNLLTANGLDASDPTDTTPDVSRQGIFSKLYDTLNSSITRITHQAGASDADNDSTLNSLGTQVSDIEKQISTMQDKLDTEEERLWKQFNYMDTMMGKMNTQSTMLANMLGIGSS